MTNKKKQLRKIPFPKHIGEKESYCATCLNKGTICDSQGFCELAGKDIPEKGDKK